MPNACNQVWDYIFSDASTLLIVVFISLVAGVFLLCLVLLDR